MKVFKAFIKPFEVPQRSVKIKIKLNFFSLFGIGTGRVQQRENPPEGVLFTVKNQASRKASLLKTVLMFILNAEESFHS